MWTETMMEAIPEELRGFTAPILAVDGKYLNDLN
jgi:hypothetical protein